MKSDGKNPSDLYQEIKTNIEDHHKWFQSSIPLVASENVTSSAVRAALATDLGHRYAE
ncbi:MAG: hypothetical protein V3U25_00315 [Nitrososphaerales archaeon]|jgi:glycine hydroxymethyltransferase